MTEQRHDSERDVPARVRRAGTRALEIAENLVYAGGALLLVVAAE